jgi:poly-gamma-glutamate capsule biosynthesis protein CapA/YwtB (metallophosphatase superfamily)
MSDHAHILKGFEVYRGVPILYSLGNFAMDLPMTREHQIDSGVDGGARDLALIVGDYGENEMNRLVASGSELMVEAAP